MYKRIIRLALLVCILISLATIGAYAQDYSVTIATIRTQMDALEVDNSKENIPMIVYSEQIYMPITDNFISVLGYEINSVGNMIDLVSKDIRESYKPGESSINKTDISYTATRADREVSINGSKLKSTEYPILKFRDTIYIPLTWEVAFQLNCHLYYSSEHGFQVVSALEDYDGVSIADGYIFFTQYDSLYRMNLDGTDIYEYKNIDTNDYVAKNGWIYFRSFDLFKMKYDGTAKTKIDNINDNYKFIQNKMIDFEESFNKYVLRVNGNDCVMIYQDKTEAQKSPLNQVENPWVYTLDKEGYLLKLNIHTYEKHVLTDYPVNNVYYAEGYVYFRTEDNVIKRLNENTYAVEELEELRGRFTPNTYSFTLTYTIDNNVLYFSDREDYEKLYSFNLSTKELKKLTDDGSYATRVINNTLYRTNHYAELNSLLQTQNIVTMEEAEFKLNRKNLKYIIDGKVYDNDYIGHDYLSGYTDIFYMDRGYVIDSINIHHVDEKRTLIVTDDSNTISTKEISINNRVSDTIFMGESEGEDNDLREIYKSDTNGKYISWYEVYDTGGGVLAYDVNIMNYEAEEITTIDAELSFVNEIMHPKKLWNDYLLYVTHNPKEEESTIILYDLMKKREEKSFKVPYAKYDNEAIPIVYSLDIDDGSLVFAYFKDGDIIYKTYDIEKKRLRTNSFSIDAILGIVTDLSLDMENKQLAVKSTYAIDEDNIGKKLSVVDINTGREKYVYDLNNVEYMALNNLKLEDGIMYFNVLEKEASDYKFNGVLLDINDSDRTIIINNCYKLIKYGDFILQLIGDGARDLKVSKSQRFIIEPISKYLDK